MKCCTGKPSRAAKMRRDRVTIKKQVIDRTDGQSKSTPTAITGGKNVRANVVDLRGSQFKRGDQQEATADYRVELRYRDDCDPTQEVEVVQGKLKGKTLNVVAVVFEPPEGRPRETHLLCKHKAA